MTHDPIPEKVTRHPIPRKRTFPLIGMRNLLLTVGILEMVLSEPLASVTSMGFVQGALALTWGAFIVLLAYIAGMRRGYDPCLDRYRNRYPPKQVEVRHATPRTGKVPGDS